MPIPDSPRWMPWFVLVALAVAVGCADESEDVRVEPPAASPPQAPDSFRVRFETSRGDFIVAVTRAWSPVGADRFHEMVTKNYFSGVRFFRVVPGFVAQFGMHGDTAVNAAWRGARIADEAVQQSNVRGTIVFATSGPNTRSNQLFINLADNARLDGMGFSPFGRVVEGMEVVESINAEYGERPNQAQIGGEGNAYLEREFPRLDYIRAAAILGAGSPSP